MNKPASFLALKVQADAGHLLALLFGSASTCPATKHLAITDIKLTHTRKGVLDKIITWKPYFIRGASWQHKRTNTKNDEISI